MYRNYDEIFLVQQLSASSVQWILVTLIAGIFFVIAFRREAIEALNLFRLGIILLAVSMVLTAILPTIRWLVLHSSNQSLDLGSLLLTSVGVLVNAIALICIVFSMLPRKLNVRSDFARTPVVKKHPLDD
jgi:hypothetical protein